MKKRSNGFTLIELLVVVLIIGILAAVALPQYQKTVEKTAIAEAMPLLKNLYQATQAYYLTHGEWPTKFNQLDVEVPWTGTERWNTTQYVTDTRSNDKWSLQLYHEENYHEIWLGRLTGPYVGCGFLVTMRSGNYNCMERFNNTSYRFTKQSGDYCAKIIGLATQPASTTKNARYWYM